MFECPSLARADIVGQNQNGRCQPVPAVWTRRSLGVASRTIIGTLVKQIRVLLVPVLHGLRSPFWRAGEGVQNFV